MTHFIQKTIVACLVLFSTCSLFTYAHDISNEISAKNAKQYTEQFIVGGQPTEADLTALAKNGIKTVINLRGVGEFSKFAEKAKVEALGMNYIAIPIDGADGINKENLTLFSAAIKNKSKTFVHCASGNRVGAMFALDAYYNDHANVEEAVVIGKKAGLTRLENKVRKVMADH
jgi:uncharacterized protein (TIGR01244 family)